MRREALLGFLLLFLRISIPHARGVNGSRKPEDIILRNEETIRSGIFELGFFNDSQTNHYLGIWIHKDDESSSVHLHHKSDVVWVANRNDPITSSSGAVLKIGRDGNLILTDEAQDQFVVVNKNSYKKVNNEKTYLTLKENGNLVLADTQGHVVWQSFDHPTDAFLPGMKIGWFGLRSDRPKNRVIASWAGPDDPGQGEFSLGAPKNDSKALSAWPRGGDWIDVGSWDGHSFGFVFMNLSNSYNFTRVSNDEETYFSFETKSGFAVSWLVISSTGRIEERYVVDGAVVTETHLVCEPRPSGVGANNASRCLNSGPSQCYEDVFSETNGTMPLSLFLSGLVEAKDDDCEVTCRNNCSCAAFVLFPYDFDAGCYVYYGNKTRLLDVLEKGEPGIVHIRGDLPSQIHGKKQRRPRMAAMYISILLATLAVIIFILAIPSCYFIRLIRCCKEKQREEMIKKGWTRLQYAPSDSQSSVFASARRLGLGLENKKHQEMFFSLSAIEAATNYFALANKLGEGGFGPVYKGQLPEGQEIAVKRLSKLSRQGVEEFKNEVTLIFELQHRNLVKILGCCIEGDENMLIYEYMPNKSLDSFLFDSSKRALLDWNMRVNIIYGIAQGLLYLHKFSRLKIIHRDLKTSNILLDGDMNPKISDFGMARIFKEDEIQALTKRVVGTYGYMSPEYAMYGHFSEKSDVFSFGIILLEIISGQKSVALYDPRHALNLPKKAFELWKEGKGMEFVDSKLLSSARGNQDHEDIIRCIGLGLMCVKERPGDRPDMSDIVSVLSTEIALCQRRRPEDHVVLVERLSSSSIQEQYCSTQHIEFTEISPR